MYVYVAPLLLCNSAPRLSVNSIVQAGKRIFTCVYALLVLARLCASLEARAITTASLCIRCGAMESTPVHRGLHSQCNCEVLRSTLARLGAALMKSMSFPFPSSSRHWNSRSSSGFPTFREKSSYICRFSLTAKYKKKTPVFSHTRR